ncbi:unnamed protein product, partial [Didymodactylos carnosus]
YRLVTDEEREIVTNLAVNYGKNLKLIREVIIEEPYGVITEYYRKIKEKTAMSTPRQLTDFENDESPSRKQRSNTAVSTNNVNLAQLDKPSTNELENAQPYEEKIEDADIIYDEISSTAARNTSLSSDLLLVTSMTTGRALSRSALLSFAHLLVKNEVGQLNALTTCDMKASISQLNNEEVFALTNETQPNDIMATTMTYQHRVLPTTTPNLTQLGCRSTITTSMRVSPVPPYRHQRNLPSSPPSDEFDMSRTAPLHSRPITLSDITNMEDEDVKFYKITKRRAPPNSVVVASIYQDAKCFIRRLH